MSRVYRGDDFMGWRDYAKENSYGHNKAQCKEQLAPVRPGPRENDYKHGDDWREDQKQEEKCAYSISNKVARDSCYHAKKR